MNDITENGKYYIPSIEEFHIGFEFEQNHSEYGWEKMIYNRLSTKTQLSYRHPTSVLNSDLIGGFIRVRKLSHEDILLCGWEETKEIGAAKMYKYSSGSDLVFFNSVPNRVEVQREQPYDCNFSGTLNNINELRTIMKQIGI